ncbi:hypothetical protein [Flavobacterium sp. ZS1P14]|uniref:hypothetical protein n=1 Tax=Flavobacterium sp. ZS1P14 TaxID=3401729 RepID=UPI003AAB4991
MKEKRALPTINIEATEFLVDVNKLELSEKSNPKNIISIFHMRDLGDGYEFSYGLQEKNIPHLFSSNKKITVTIPELVKLDPEGMAAKYNITDVTSKSDFDLMVDQDALQKRIRLGHLPTVDIARHTFYADARIDLLRPKDDYTTMGIRFSEIDHYFDEEKNCYIIPYNPTTHEFQELDYDNITEYPKELLAIEFPHEYKLDPIGWNRRNGFDETQNLKRIGLKLQFKARTIPWNETGIDETIKENLKRLQSKKMKPGQSQSTPDNPTKKKGRKM